MKFSLINVYQRQNGLVQGRWIQNHVGTLATAQQVATETEKVNGNKITVAVVGEIASPVPHLDSSAWFIPLTMNAEDLDIIDLNDWVLFNDPDMYAATKYISDTNVLMKLWTTSWRKAGCPEIRQPAS